MKFFLYSSSVSSSTSWYLLLLLDPYNICALLCPSLYEMFPWYHYFSWRDLWSFPFYCFPLSLCTDHWGRLSYLCAILWNSAFKSIFPFLLCFLLLLFSQLFIRPPQTTILPFCISFSWWWSWSPHPVQCHKLPSIVLQALCLSGLIPWIYLSLPLYNCKSFDLIWVIPEWTSGFPYFLQFKPEFCNKELMIWATVSSRSYFCWLYRASPSLASKNIISLISVLII